MITCHQFPGHTNQNTSSALAGLEGDIAPIAVNPDGFLPCQPTTAGVFTNHCDLRPTSPGAHPADAAAAGHQVSARSLDSAFLT